MALASGSGFCPGRQRLERAGQTAPVEEISGIEKNQEEQSDSGGGADTGWRPLPLRCATQGRSKGRDAVPEQHEAGGQNQGSGVNGVGLFVEDHSGQSEYGGPQAGPVAVQPKGDGTPSEEHGEEDEPRFVDRIPSVKNTSGGDGKGQRRPAHRFASEPAGEKKKNRKAEQAGQDNRQPQCPKVASEQFLREKDGVKMPWTVKIIRSVSKGPCLPQAVGEPSVDPFIEMRGLEIKQNKAEQGREGHDGHEVPRPGAHFPR